jgi:hypothetical protein
MNCAFIHAMQLYDGRADQESLYEIERVRI